MSHMAEKAPASSASAVSGASVPCALVAAVYPRTAPCREGRGPRRPATLAGGRFLAALRLGDCAAVRPARAHPVNTSRPLSQPCADTDGHADTDAGRRAQPAAQATTRTAAQTCARARADTSAHRQRHRSRDRAR